MHKFTLVSAALLLIAYQAMAQKIVYSAHQSVVGPYQCSPAFTARDSAGDFYVAGTAEGQVYTEKKSPGGAVIYTHFFSDPPLTTVNPQFLASNSHGDVFVAGVLWDGITGNQAGTMLYCISSGGSTLWSMKDTTHFNVGGLAIGADGDPIVGLARQKGSDSTTHNFDLIKYNATTGGIVWKSLQSLNTINTVCIGLAAGSGHLYAVVYAQPTQNTGGYDAIAYNDTNGQTLWNKPAGPYSKITDYTPRCFSALPSGDFLVTGQGTGYTTGGWTVATFDRFKSTDGSFVFRKFAGPMSGSDAYVDFSTPTTDSAGNIYWAGAFTNGTTQASHPVAGKMSALGISQFLTALPAGAYGSGNHTEAAPLPSGEEFVLTVPGGLAEVSAINNQGTVLYTKTIPVDFQTFGFSIDLYIDVSGNPSVVGGSYDALGDAVNRLVTLVGTTGATKIDSRTTPTGAIYSDFQQAATDTSGNVYVAGSAGLFCGVTKYSPSGVVLWTKQIYPTLPWWDGFPVAISWSPRGEIVVAAEISPYNVSDLNLGVVKLDAADGDLIWAANHTSSGHSFYPIYALEDSVGNVIVAGEIYNTTTYAQGGIVTKFASTNGAVAWEHADSTVSFYSGLTIDSQGGVVLTGANTYTQGGQYEVKKYNAAGTQVYLHTSTSANTSGLNALAMDSLGNAYEACFDVGKINLYRYSPTGAGGLLKSYTVPSASQIDCELIFDIRHDALFLMVTQQPDNADYSTITMRITPATGALVWTDSFQRGNVIYNSSLGQTYMLWDVDTFGNVVLAGLSATTMNHPSDMVIRKLKFATGTPRYTYTYAGPLASPLDYEGGIVAGSDGMPVLYGSAPSPFGPGSSQALIAKFADTNAPICANDAYSVKSGVTLTIAAPGVLANDEDAAGATVALVTAPTHKSAFSLSASGAFSYKSATGYKGIDTFTYKATNSYGASNVATVTITVQ